MQRLRVSTIRLVSCSLACAWRTAGIFLPPATTAKMAAVVAKREGPQFISEVAMRGNAAVLDYCRTSVSALSGATAGILGLTGLYGFVFYVLSSFLLSLLLILKAGRRWNKCFKSRRLLFTGGLVGGLFTYVLFWTFLYGMVHVY
ncbi:ER membrane protein complex subunit 6 isoform X1 [Nerophis lumbriciformis]|uniref:ER membrane protein complex subunit 6 isoform X1 n=2 Tax=Syngnathinae TaxID=129914 RepID=UPI002ADF7DBD|nr:ER membrane protein complex subunit 6-like isoform X1 [Nerophis lumbriciformis]XP_061819294.1 ER membrane protein complex subunit 6-like isoform X1 [Nerophis lumbriciformis]